MLLGRYIFCIDLMLCVRYRVLIVWVLCARPCFFSIVFVSLGRPRVFCYRLGVVWAASFFYCVCVVWMVSCFYCMGCVWAVSLFYCMGAVWAVSFFVLYWCCLKCIVLCYCMGVVCAVSFFIVLMLFGQFYLFIAGLFAHFFYCMDVVWAASFFLLY